MNHLLPWHLCWTLSLLLKSFSSLTRVFCSVQMFVSVRLGQMMLRCSLWAVREEMWCLWILTVCFWRARVCFVQRRREHTTEHQQHHNPDLHPHITHLHESSVSKHTITSETSFQSYLKYKLKVRVTIYIICWYLCIINLFIANIWIISVKRTIKMTKLSLWKYISNNTDFIKEVYMTLTCLSSSSGLNMLSS